MGSIRKYSNDTIMVVDNSIVILISDQSRISNQALLAVRKTFLWFGIRYFNLNNGILTAHWKSHDDGKGNIIGCKEMLDQLADKAGRINVEVLVDGSRLNWNGVKFEVKTFHSSKVSLMEHMLPRVLGDSNVKAECEQSLSNGGLENEASLAAIVERQLRQFKRIDLEFSASPIVWKIKDVIGIVHTGTMHQRDYGKADIMIETRKGPVYLSIKTDNAIEYEGGSCVKKDPELEGFARNVLESGLVSITPCKNAFQRYDCQIRAKGKSQIVCVPSRNLMDRAMFGFDKGVRCDAVIFGNFYEDMDMENEVSIQDGDDRHNPKLSIKAHKIALNVDDVINTDYEPRMLIGAKKATNGGRITLSNSNDNSISTYCGLALRVVHRRRVNGHEKETPSRTTIMF